MISLSIDINSALQNAAFAGGDVSDFYQSFQAGVDVVQADQSPVVDFSDKNSAITWTNLGNYKYSTNVNGFPALSSNAFGSGQKRIYASGVDEKLITEDVDGKICSMCWVGDATAIGTTSSLGPFFSLVTSGGGSSLHLRANPVTNDYAITIRDVTDVSLGTLTGQVSIIVTTNADTYTVWVNGSKVIDAAAVTGNGFNTALSISQYDLNDAVSNHVYHTALLEWWARELTEGDIAVLLDKINTQYGI